MTAVDDLVTWLRQQLAEDEQVAREAVDQGGIGRGGEKHWTRCYADRRGLIGDMAGNVVVHGIAETWSPSSYQAEHIARWDPARVLAEVKAKRELLDCLVGATGKGTSRLIANDEPWAMSSDYLVRLFVRPYAGRPGWREEWAA